MNYTFHMKDLVEWILAIAGCVFFLFMFLISIAGGGSGQPSRPAEDDTSKGSYPEALKYYTNQEIKDRINKRTRDNIGS